MKKCMFLLVAIIFTLVLAMPSTVNAADKTAKKKWTVMVFSNADNNLDTDLCNDLKEMETAGTSDDVNVLVEIDRLNKPARRYQVSPRSMANKPDDWGFCSNKLAELGELDMGHPKVLDEFITWSVTNYPAAKYMLIIQNHGSGWRKTDKKITRGISYDDQSKHYISTKELGRVFAKAAALIGKPLDIFGTDACLMQMLEVDYEIKDSVSYIVSSEEVVPGPGWPYEYIFSPLFGNASINAKEFATMIPSIYNESYKKSEKDNATMSTVDCKEIDTLAKAVDAFAIAAKEAMTTDASEIKIFQEAHKQVQKYYDRDNMDIGHFMKLINETSKNAKIKEAATQVLMAYQKCIMTNAFNNTAMSNSSGMAIFFPRTIFNLYYRTLKFQALNWDEMIKIAEPKLIEFHGNEDDYEAYDPHGSDVNEDYWGSPSL